MGRQIIPETEPLWRALADPTRRAVLDLLRKRPHTTGELAESFPTSRFAVMQHLDVLVGAGLVTVERRGRERWNHINAVPLQEAYERWVQPLAAPTASGLLRLAKTAEERGGQMSKQEFGIDIRAEHPVRADASRTWQALMHLDDWWPKCWPDDERLLFEPCVGGRLGTTTARAFSANTGGTLWGIVSALYPEQELVVDGGMGIVGPVNGQWRLTLSPEPGITRVAVHHRVIGAVDSKTKACFTSGWTDTLAALADRAEEAA